MSRRSSHLQRVAKQKVMKLLQINLLNLLVKIMKGKTAQTKIIVKH